MAAIARLLTDTDTSGPDSCCEIPCRPAAWGHDWPAGTECAQARGQEVGEQAVFPTMMSPVAPLLANSFRCSMFREMLPSLGCG